MGTTDLFRIAIFATSLAFLTAVGPASAGAEQGSKKVCQTACGNAANTMMNQKKTVKTVEPTEFGGRSKSRTEPAYTPDQVNDFLNKCWGNCK